MAFNLQIYEEITNLQKNITETEFHKLRTSLFLSLTFSRKKNTYYTFLPKQKK